MYYSEYFLVLLNDYINIKRLNNMINHLQVTYTIQLMNLKNTPVTKNQLIGILNILVFVLLENICFQKMRIVKL